MAPRLAGQLWRCWGFGLSPFSLVSGHAYVEEQTLNAIRAWRGWAAHEAAITTWDVLYHTGGRMLPLVSGHAYVEEQTLNAIRAAPPALHVLSTIAAVLSPFCLFLMALALRLKFRMSI